MLERSSWKNLKDGISKQLEDLSWRDLSTYRIAGWRILRYFLLLRQSSTKTIAFMSILILGQTIQMFCSTQLGFSPLPVTAGILCWIIFRWSSQGLLAKT